MEHARPISRAHCSGSTPSDESSFDLEKYCRNYSYLPSFSPPIQPHASAVQHCESSAAYFSWPCRIKDDAEERANYFANLQKGVLPENLFLSNKRIFISILQCNVQLNPRFKKPKKERRNLIKHKLKFSHNTTYKIITIESHTAATAKRTDTRIWPRKVDNRLLAPAFRGKDDGGGGGFSTLIASFMPEKQNPLPLMK